MQMALPAIPPARPRAALLLAALLTYGVVLWEHAVHRVAGALGPAEVSWAVWLRDGALTFPLALLAVWAGLTLAARRGLGPVASAALITGLFTALLAPATAFLRPAAHHTLPAAVPALPGGLPQLALPALHGLVDALLALPVALLLVRLGLAVLAGGSAAPLVPRLAGGGRTLLGVALVLPAVALPVALAEAQPPPGQTRTYYIAADEVDWDYAPSDVNRITGRPFNRTARTWVEGGDDRIGRVYRKALYREYTDATFSTLKPVPPEWEHLGALGPVIHAAVGDTIQVVFRNNTRYPFSVHAHGVQYTKANEGAPYADGTPEADRADDAVPPGGTYTYTWTVPERAGPGPADPSSVVWMYHSHVGEVTDTNTGLVGPLIVTRRDAARPDGRPADVDREIVAFFNVYDENLSIYLDDNIQRFVRDPRRVKKDDEEFKESNLKHTINGYLYGTLPGLTMRPGERVRWYLVALGSEEGLHSTHWHGQTVVWHGMRMDGVELLPMSMKVADMVPDTPGTWLFHCHVNDHLIAGMAALFTVAP